MFGRNASRRSIPSMSARSWVVPVRNWMTSMSPTGQVAHRAAAGVADRGSPLPPASHAHDQMGAGVTAAADPRAVAPVRHHPHGAARGFGRQDGQRFESRSVGAIVSCAGSDGLHKVSSPSRTRRRMSTTRPGWSSSPGNWFAAHFSASRRWFTSTPAEAGMETIWPSNSSRIRSDSIRFPSRTRPPLAA